MQYIDTYIYISIYLSIYHAASTRDASDPLNILSIASLMLAGFIYDKQVYIHIYPSTTICILHMHGNA